MGYFSWRVCDGDKSSIPVSAVSTHPNSGKIVYLLQPNGKASIACSRYEGFGNFGGTDAYAWVALNNLPLSATKTCSQEELETLGIALDMGEYYDAGNGHLYSFHYHKIVDELEPFEGNYGTPQALYDDLTPNELIKSGKWVAKPIRELFGLTEDNFKPLKFSFDKDAIYEELPASEDCPHQGFFYPEDELF